MNIYLIQHGEARSKEEDPKRSLSEKGKADAEKTARFLSKIGIKVSSIFHSGKERALETAKIIGKYLNIEPVQENGLSPLDDPGIWFNKIKEMNEDIMIVGHLPHLSKLSSMLILGDPEKEVISFRMAGVVCLNKKENVWTVAWMVIPELL